MNVTARIFVCTNLLWLFLAASNGLLRAQTDASATAEGESRIPSISSEQIEKTGNYKLVSPARPLFEYDRVAQSITTTNIPRNHPTLNSERKVSHNAISDDCGVCLLS